MPALQPLDWVIAGAAAVSLYVLVDMWIREQHGAPAPVDGQE
jgi:hypothetical protein